MSFKKEQQKAEYQNQFVCVFVCVCSRACVCVCVRARARACVCVCARACVCVCLLSFFKSQSGTRLENNLTNPNKIGQLNFTEEINVLVSGFVFCFFFVFFIFIFFKSQLMTVLFVLMKIVKWNYFCHYSLKKTKVYRWAWRLPITWKIM